MALQTCFPSPYLYSTCTDQSFPSTHHVIVCDSEEIQTCPLAGTVQGWERKLEANQSHIAQAKVRTNTPGFKGNGSCRFFKLQLEVSLLYCINFLLRHLSMNLSTLSIGFSKLGCKLETKPNKKAIPRNLRFCFLFKLKSFGKGWSLIYPWWVRGVNITFCWCKLIVWSSGIKILG